MADEHLLIEVVPEIGASLAFLHPASRIANPTACERGQPGRSHVETIAPFPELFQRSPISCRLLK
ncbi:hypothetical protein ABH945_003987 [Paraburkholderia sp. GAS333]|uniref:hypothetical protein n=1 Tax=Paraburkholderia sp. GAS333 TaxID=3156279 RepID=UPI003D1E776F